jgi:hypothetical protein
MPQHPLGWLDLPGLAIWLTGHCFEVSLFCITHNSLLHQNSRTAAPPKQMSDSQPAAG